MALTIGEKIIPFDLPSTDGKTYSINQYADKAALAIVFTCNHCPYALAWEGRLMQIQADYAEKGVQLLGINANNAITHPGDSFENMQKQVENHNWNFPYLHDESQEVAHAYGATRTPEIFLFDDDGVLRYHGAPDDNYEDPSAVTAPYFRDALDAILAGKTPATNATPPVGCTIKWK